MMVENQRAKAGSLDDKAAAVKGALRGAGIGLVLAAVDYTGSGDVKSALTQFFAIGGLIGSILSINALMGKSVYVPDLADATNRLKVDFAGV